MMAGLDRGVGLVLDALEEHGLADRTLVVFLSDNGGPTGLKHPRPTPDAPFALGVNTSRNDPLRGVKGQLYEGGIRVPFMAAWPGVIPGGRVSDRPVISLDIAATAVALAGLEPDGDRPLDGVDLMPLLTGEGDLPERNLYWRVKHLSAIRSGDWKFLKLGAEPPQLYNLADDIDESENLVRERPGKARELRSALRDWLRTLEPPRW
jgi:arylsulfatase A-like enzyme